MEGENVVAWFNCGNLICRFGGPRKSQCRMRRRSHLSVFIHQVQEMTSGVSDIRDYQSQHQVPTSVGGGGWSIDKICF